MKKKNKVMDKEKQIQKEIEKICDAMIRFVVQGEKKNNQPLTRKQILKKIKARRTLLRQIAGKKKIKVDDMTDKQWMIFLKIMMAIE